MQKLRDLVGLAPPYLGTEKASTGPVAERQRVCSLLRESQLRWQERVLETETDEEIGIPALSLTSLGTMPF